MRTRLSGFTLIELMIVVAVMGIIAAIAIPSYNNYVLRGNRTVGKTEVLRIVGKQEAFYNDRKAYATALNLLDNTLYSGATVYLKRDGRTQAANTTDTIYALTLTGTSATAYTVQATAVNRQTKDTGCTTLTVNQLNEKTPTTGDCWTR